MRRCKLRFFTKGGQNFMSFNRVCSKCGKITIDEMPVLPPSSRGQNSQYDNYPNLTCGNCGNAL